MACVHRSISRLGDSTPRGVDRGNMAYAKLQAFIHSGQSVRHYEERKHSLN